MRVHLTLTQTDKTFLRFNYQDVLTRAIHKWLGENDIHNNISLYSFSWLYGAQAVGNGLRFPRGARWFISAHNGHFLEKLIAGIRTAPELGSHLAVSEMVIQNTPSLVDSELVFGFASPILVKRTVNTKDIHYTYRNSESDTLLTETLKRKLRTAKMDDSGVTVSFDRSFRDARTKVIYYKNIGNRVSLCPVRISGSSEQLRFAWNVGVGNSTGIGFGALNSWL